MRRIRPPRCPTASPSSPPPATGRVESPHKPGPAEARAEFLKQIERWRELLARNIALRNPRLSVREMNYAVSKTIDRIIFLRMCEDRGIETYAHLRGLLNGPNIYKRLVELFYRADERYNSGLFYFREEKARADAPDDLTPGLVIDDRVLKEIIKGLYYPDCPYEFSVLPADILGQVYEQFLGKVIRLTKGHRAVVEEKPEVKKAGGVYYTPTYIVDYIVKHTVGKLLEGRSVRWIGRQRGKKVGCPRLDGTLRVLDPACGSGSFLLGAYQYLLDWYLDWYSTHDPEKWARRKNPPICQIAGSGGWGPGSGADATATPHTPHPKPQPPTWRLTIAERKRILLDHIYGVDIDPQAVEVTKLSLLLKVLEGESPQTLDNQLKLFHERALPDLASNIKCGNSLIGPDFYDNQQVTPLDEEERRRINVFDWHAEFPKVFAGPDPGFDAVIGNPPYLSYSGRQAAELSPAERAYFRRVGFAAGWSTSHGMFIERSVRHLSRRSTSFIVPDQMGHLAGYRSVRRTISRWSRLVEVRYWGEGVFENVVTPALSFVADKAHAGQTTVYPPDGGAVRIRCSGGEPWTAQRARSSLPELRVRTYSLGDLVADPGVHTGNCAKKLIFPAPEAIPGCVPVLEGRQISRYRCERPVKVLRLTRRPKAGEYFTIRPKDTYTKASFVIRQTAPYPIVGPREHADYFRNSLLALYSPVDGTDVRYLVGLLNSRLIRYMYAARVQESRQKTFPQVKVRSLRELPIRAVDFSDADDRSRHERVVQLVQRMLDLHRLLSATEAPGDRRAIQCRIEATDRRIDALVCELYGLTDEEIARVEEATRR